MKNKTRIFVDELVSAQHDRLLAIEILGSRKGEDDLQIADIDFLILCRHRTDIDCVFKTVLEVQSRIFSANPTGANRFIQRHLLGSNSYNGIHSIVLGRDELDDDFQPVSFRLRLLSKLIGRNLFLHEIKQNHNLLYGENFTDRIQIRQPGFVERLACFIFPGIILLIALPAILFSNRTFKIWCLKAIKYHFISLRAFLDLTGQRYPLDDALFDKASYFRYRPDEYPHSAALLYMRAWASIFKNYPLIFSSTRKTELALEEREI